MSRAGQRRQKIPVSQIRKLSQWQCTEKEASAFLGVPISVFREMIRVDGLAKRAWEDGREIGKVTLRKSQFTLAERNATMSIWLGRQLLGQADVVRVEHTGRDGGPVKTLDLTQLSPDQRKGLRDAITAARKK